MNLYHPYAGWIRRIAAKLDEEGVNSNDMSYTRCDVASWGGQEVRAATGTPLIPEANFVRAESCPNGLICITYDWGENAYLLVSTSGGFAYQRYDLGPRRGNNSHCPRWIPSQSRCLVFKIYAAGDQYAGEYWAVGFDGYPLSLGPFDVTNTGATGIRDVTQGGGNPQFLSTTNVWPDSEEFLPPGMQLLNWRQRGPYTVGVLSHTWLGVSVFNFDTSKWYRAYPYNVDLLPGIAENGTVAASGADPGGFVPMSDWLTRPFDPFPIDPPDPVEPEIPRMIAYNAPVAGFLPGELVNHPDGPPYVGIRKPNGKVVAVTPDGKVEERDGMSSWERFRVSQNGASLIAERDGNRVYVLPLAR